MGSKRAVPTLGNAFNADERLSAGAPAATRRSRLPPPRPLALALAAAVAKNACDGGIRLGLGYLCSPPPRVLDYLDLETRGFWVLGCAGGRPPPAGGRRDDCWRTEAVGRLLGVQKCASGHPLWCTRLAVLGLWDGDLCCRVCRGPHFPARRSASTRARRASIDALAGPLRPCLAGPSSATQTGVGLRAWSGQAAAAASCLRRTPRASWFLSRNGRPVRLAVAHAD